MDTLVELSTQCYCDTLNFGVFGDAVAVAVKTVLLLPDQLFSLVCLHLHYRFIEVLQKHDLDSDRRDVIRKCIGLSMHLEDNVHRTRELHHISERIPLMDVHESLSRFCHEPVSNNDLCKKAVDSESILKPGEISSPIQFRENLNAFAQGQLKLLNWANLFVAGGAVAACLRAVPENTDRKEYYERHYETSDIDIFIVAPSWTSTEFIKKLEEMYFALQKGTAEPLHVMCTPNSITFFRGYPYRCIQVNLCQYASNAEVISNFDIDCCCVGYNGYSVLCLPRFVRSINRKAIVVNGGLRVANIERLLKYNYRGFGLCPQEFTATCNANGGAIDKSKITNLCAFAKAQLLHQNSSIFGIDFIKWYFEWHSGVTYNRNSSRSTIFRSFAQRDENRPEEGNLQVNSMEFFDTGGSYGRQVFIYQNKTTPQDIIRSVSFNESEIMFKGNQPLIPWLGECKKRQEEKATQHRAPWFGPPNFCDWDIAGPKYKYSPTTFSTSNTKVEIMNLRSFEGEQVFEIQSDDFGWSIHFSREDEGLAFYFQFQPDGADTDTSPAKKRKIGNKIICSCNFMIKTVPVNDEREFSIDSHHHFTPENLTSNKCIIYWNYAQSEEEPQFPDTENVFLEVLIQRVWPPT